MVLCFKNGVQVGLLNVDGYYNSLLSFIDKAVDEGFISPTARRIIVSAPTAKELVRELEVLQLFSLFYIRKINNVGPLVPSLFYYYFIYSYTCDRILMKLIVFDLK